MLKIKFLFLTISLLFSQYSDTNFYLPVNSSNRKSLNKIKLTEIGKFGLMRKARPKIPAHYHTGIDIKRPTQNYQQEPIFPIAEGVIISKREQGPYSQLIIEHRINGKIFWTAYEHIVAIKVGLHEFVKPDTPLARFMNADELDRYGWQFDHFHFEVLKVAPMKLKYDPSHPERHFSSYTLVCYTKEDLNKYFYNPLEFMKIRF